MENRTVIFQCRLSYFSGQPEMCDAYLMVLSIFSIVLISRHGLALSSPCVTGQFSKIYKNEDRAIHILFVYRVCLTHKHVIWLPFMYEGPNISIMIYKTNHLLSNSE